jgi:hypothetical protein
MQSLLTEWSQYKEETLGLPITSVASSFSFFSLQQNIPIIKIYFVVNTIPTAPLGSIMSPIIQYPPQMSAFRVNSSQPITLPAWGPIATPGLADPLIVSANTVRTHIQNIYRKHGVDGRSGVVRRAREFSLLA